LVVDYEEAKDILQESFVDAFRSYGKLNNKEAFGGWLKQIVIRNSIKYLKKKPSLYTLSEEYEQLEDSDDEGWFMELSFNEIHKEIKELPNGCRQVFVLFVLERYSHKDIAALLGVSESTSKNQFQRARRLLQQRLIKNLKRNET
jgi:RNA polymerase sigma-70 factor (ECF subfamily)